MDTAATGLSPMMFDTARANQIKTGDSEEQIAAVGVEFEGVFLSMMLKEMRNSLENGGFFGEEGSDTYGGMFDLFIGKHLASSQPLGISELLVEQYQKSQAASNSAGEAAASDDAAPTISITG